MIEPPRIPLPNGLETNPDYFALGDQGFEDLCAALLSGNPGLVDVSRVDPQGRKQWGVDVRARFGSGGGEYVLSAKCEHKAEKKKLIKWSDDFLNHWESHWKKLGVRRFVLACAEPKLSTASFNQIGLERARFEQRGVAYEYWGPVQLTEKCRERIDIVNRFFVRGWSALLCPETESEAIEQLTHLNATLRDSARRAGLDRLESLVRDRSEGRQIGFVNALLELERDTAIWTTLGAAQQARVHRLKAERLAAVGRYAEAVEELDKADAFDGGREGRPIRAHFEMLNGRLRKALSLLDQPRNEHERSMRAILHIVEGDASAAIADLEGLAQNNPKYARLRAMADWTRGLEEGALRAIEALAKAHPSDYAVQRDRVHIEYAAVFPSIVPFRMASIPYPYPFGVHHEDDTAVARLRQVDELVRSLLVLPLDIPDRHQLEMLRLGALTFRRDTADQARRYAAELVIRDIPNGHAMRWCLSYGWPFDHAVASGALHAALRGPEPQAAQLEALLILYGHADRHQEAFHALNDYSEKFSLPEAVQGFQRAKKSVQKALKQQHRYRKPEPHTTEALAKIVALAPTDKTLFEWWQACEMLARRSAWEALKVALPFIETALYTAEGARLKVFVEFHTKGAQAALPAIVAAADLYPAHVLPPQLRRIRIQGLIDAGRFTEAREESQALAAAESLPQDRLVVMQVANQLADYESIVAQARELHPRDLSPREALYVAQSTAPHDPQLARTFWVQANAQGIPDELAPSAAVLGVQLDVGALVRDAMARFVAAAESGSSNVATALSLNELVDYINQNRQRNEELAARWQKGEAPIHAVLTRPADLVRSIALVFEKRRPIPFPWFIHSGSRTEAPSPPPKLRLCMDTTGLLTAWALDLLDVLQTHAELYLPANMLGLLGEAHTNLLPTQPSQVRKRDAILKLVDRGQITLLDAVPSDLPAVGFFVEPPFSHNLSAFFRDLCVAAKYDETRKMSATEILGNTVEASPTADWLTSFQKIGFDAYALKLLADSFLIEDTLSHWQIVISREQYNQLQQERQAQDNDVMLAARLDGLRKRLLAGIAQQEIRLIPKPAASPNNDNHEHGPTLQLVMELLHSPIPDGAWTWIDDRTFHGLSGSDRVIVNSIDVIDTLLANHVISPRDWLSRRQRLREVGALFIPTNSAEIIAAFDRVPSRPSRALSLSQFLLASQSHSIRLEPSQVFPTELACVVKNTFGVSQAIAQLWSEPSANPQTTAEHSSRMLDGFYRNWWSADLSRCGIDVADGMEEIHLHSLLITPLGWRGADKIELDDRLRHYGAWLESAVIGPLMLRTKSDRDRLLAHAAQEFIRFVVGAEERLDPTDGPALRIVVARWFLVMPLEVVNAISSDAAFVRTLPITRSRRVTIGEFRADMSQFLDSMALALSEGASTIQDVRAVAWQIRVTRKDADSLPVVELKSMTDQHTVSDHRLLAASTRPQDRLAMLRVHPEWWDGAYPTIEAAADQMRGLHHAVDRIDVLEAMRAGCVEARYKDIAATMRVGGKIPFTDLRPLEASSHLRYLRLDSDLDVDRGASALVAQRGALEAARRYAALPDPLPEPLLIALGMEPQGDMSALVQEFLDSTSLLHRLHGVVLARRYDDSDLPVVRTVREILVNGLSSLEALRPLLQWAQSYLAGEGPPTSASRLLAWSHVGALLHVLPKPKTWTDVVMQAQDDAASGLLAALSTQGTIDDSLAPSEFNPHKAYASFGALLLQTMPNDDWLDEDARAAIAATACLQAGKERLPHPGALPYTAERSGGGAWLRLAPDRLFAAADIQPEGTTTIHGITAQWQRAAVASVSAGIYSNEAWTLLLNICPAIDIDREGAELIGRAATIVDTSRLRAACNDSVWAAMTHWMVDVAARFDIPELGAFARALIDTAFQTLAEDNLVWIDALVGAARKPSAAETLQGIVEHLSSLLAVTPASANRIARVVTAFRVRTTISDFALFRPLELALQEAVLAASAP